MLMVIIAIIPARMASSRFPGKPLGSILGLSMIEHVRRRTLLCALLDEVIVTTCDKVIADEVIRFGGKAVMTSDKHQSCVDRIAEAAKNLKADIIINVQGDMPLLQPETLSDLVAPLLIENKLEFTDMMGSIENDQEMNNPNVVKVVVDIFNNALYYSREPIPSFQKINSGKAKRFKQFGINAFRRESLATFIGLPRTPLEKIESVDMLRLLENGHKVRMVSSSYPVVGVDTPEDLLQAEEKMKNDQVCFNYMEVGLK
jgi:3-deoxy-manno-octulosonate cytidylyltransferase (CMP-KDO synthetase)